MKTKFQITLDPYCAELLDKAVRIACHRRGDGDEPDSSNRRFVLQWMIVAVSSAIIRAGKMPDQLAVDLRHETKEEKRQRIAKEIPQPIGDAAQADRRRRTSETALVTVAQNILGKYYKPQLPDVQCVFADLLRFSTANWDKLEPLWNAQLSYAGQEALHPHDLWAAKAQCKPTRRRRRKPL